MLSLSQLLSRHLRTLLPVNHPSCPDLLTAIVSCSWLVVWTWAPSPVYIVYHLYLQMQPCQALRAAAVARAGPAAVAAAAPWHSLQHRCQSSTACCASPLTNASISMHVTVSRTSASPSKVQPQQQCKPRQHQQEQQQRGQLLLVCT